MRHVPQGEEARVLPKKMSEALQIAEVVVNEHGWYHYEEVKPRRHGGIDLAMVRFLALFLVEVTLGHIYYVLVWSRVRKP